MESVKGSLMNEETRRKEKGESSSRVDEHLKYSCYPHVFLRF